MLNLAQISQFFPIAVHNRKKWMLREYLQYIILSTIYQSQYRSKLVFLGWTCLRIGYASQRFSEDLDFDNRGMSEADFSDLGSIIAKNLTQYGLETEVKMAFKWAFHCYVRIPRVLFDYGLSGYEEEKLLIQLDTVPQPIDYPVREYTLANFGFRDTISITPPEYLLSQKIVAAYSRKRTQWRDFYDIEFLRSWGIAPAFDYLESVFGIKNPPELSSFMHEKNKSINFDALARDVEPFLFRSDDVAWVRRFGDR